MDGDEERSYVLYMKFMGIMAKLTRLPDYQKQKQQVTKILGTNETMRKHLDKLEVLSSSLKARYALKNAEKAESSPIEIDAAPLESSLSTSQLEIKNVIDCRELFTKMEEQTKLLIMDCRPEADYELSKMTYKYTLNVPEPLLTLGMTASKILERLPNESKVYWNLRETRCIIFVDWSSQRFNRNSPVWHLKEILMDWDQDVDTKPEMFLLEGGYERWVTIYPMKTTNPQVAPPKTTNGQGPAIEDVEYPNWEDILMKDASLNQSITAPQVDRSIKVNAVKAYESGKSQLELLEENEQIMNKSLMTEKELLTLETSLKQIVSDKENNEDSSSKEQSHLFKIWELQSKQKDIILEEKSIKEQIDQSKSQEKEPSSNLTTKVQQIERTILEMELERKRVHDEREKKKKERDEALKIARARKPTFNDHKTPPKSQRKDELILSPKALSNQINSSTITSIPSFDRSSKPSQIYIRQTFNEEDFAPVYGRVVSLFEFLLSVSAERKF